jgi:PhnB protein
MAQIDAYLTFDGNCREAMSFYSDCLGGELKMMSVGESPVAGQMPPEARGLIMHASLTKGPLTLMASDMVGKGALVRGNTISLMIMCESEEQLRAFFSKLSVGGKVSQPVKQEFWGALYGDLTDKFGMRWMLNFEKPKA